MKRIIVFFFFLLLGTTLFSQSTYFNKILTPFSGPNNLKSVVQADSFYYIYSYRLDISNPWREDIILLKIDLQGNMVDTAVIGMPYHSYNAVQGNSLIKMSDGNLLACGATRDTSDIIYAYLLKFTPNLDTLWSKQYAHPDTMAASQPGAEVFNYFYAIKETPDNGFIIAGNYNIDCISGEYRSYIMKTDSLGNVEFLKRYTNYYTFYDIEIAPDSGYYIPCTYNGSGNLKLIKADTEGEIDWVIDFNTQSNPFYPIDVVLFDSNTMFTSSANLYNLGYAYMKSLIVSRIDLNTKTIVWEKEYFTFVSFVSNYLDQSVSIEKTMDGNIVVGSTAMVSNGVTASPSRGFLFKLNPNGDSLWMRNYGIGVFEDECVFNDFIPTSDGGFLGVGFRFSQVTGQKDWIIKLDSFGCDTPGCHIVGLTRVKTGNLNINIYPNPATTQINLDLGSKNQIIETLNILTITGQKAVSLTNVNSSNRIDIQNLKSGIYLLEGILESGERFVGKFVKE
jgi:hypothetical protein